MHTTSPHEPLHIDSQYADRTQKWTTENMPQIDTAGRHRAQEHARSWRLRLRLRPVGRHGRCGCAGWQVGATGAPYRAHTGPDRGRNGGQIMRMRRKGAEFEALGLLRTFVGGPAADSGLWRGGRPPPNSMTALGRAHSVGTAESGCRRWPHMGTCDRYTICSHAGRPRQARALRRPSRGWSRPSRRAPTPARRRTAAGGGPRAHRKTGSIFGDPVWPSVAQR